jgi:hypothetical protein
MAEQKLLGVSRLVGIVKPPHPRPLAATSPRNGARCLLVSCFAHR